MAISLEAHPTLPQGFIKINGTTAATVTTSGITGASLTDASVAPTKLISGPVFRAWASSGTALAASFPTKVIFQTVNFDSHNCYNATLGRFTPTVAGYYQVNAKVRTDFASQIVLSVGIWKNGVVQSEGNFFAATTSQVGAVAHDIVYLNGSTDYVEIYAFSGTAGTISSLATSTNYFSAAFLRS